MIWSRFDDFALVPSAISRSLNNGENEGRTFSEIEKALEAFSKHNNFSYPALNVHYDDEKAVATMEIPGVETEDLEVTVVGKTLTVKGEKKEDKLEENSKYHSRERSYGSFTRTVTLPFAIDADNVEANCDKGILKLVLPRTHAEKPKKISIK